MVDIAAKLVLKVLLHYQEQLQEACIRLRLTFLWFTVIVSHQTTCCCVDKEMPLHTALAGVGAFFQSEYWGCPYGCPCLFGFNVTDKSRQQSAVTRHKAYLILCGWFFLNVHHFNSVFKEMAKWG